MEGRFCGRADPPLSEPGRARARDLADALSPVGFARVVASPLRRAVETAGPLADAAGVGIEVEGDLVECDFGAWEGRAWDEIASASPDQTAAYLRDPARFAFPGGESPADVRRRAVPALRDLVPPEGAPPVAAVCHSGPVRLALAEFMGGPEDAFIRARVDHGSVTILERAGGRVLVTGVNLDPARREILRWAD